MSIAPIKPGGWDEEDRLTSDEVNDFQAKLIQAGDDHDAIETRVTDAEDTILHLGATAGGLNARIVDLEAMALRPDLHVDFKEDFLGAIHNAGDSRLDAELPWRAHGSGTVSINCREGNSLHPGELECAIPGDGAGEVLFYFELIGATAGPVLINRILSATFVVKIEDHASNVNTLARLGFVSNNALFNGGDDGLYIFRQRALSATNWYLGRRNAGVAATHILLGSQTAGLYSTIRFVKNDLSGLDVFFGNSSTPAAVVTAAQFPIVLTTLGAYMATGALDSFVYTPSIDLMAMRLYLGGRHGI